MYWRGMGAHCCFRPQYISLPSGPVRGPPDHVSINFGCSNFYVRWQPWQKIGLYLASAHLHAKQNTTFRTDSLVCVQRGKTSNIKSSKLNIFVQTNIFVIIVKYLRSTKVHFSLIRILFLT